ncbi:hypothetical protein P5673_001757 [Acropora cervicornis]|uniref:Uncharacterized protein n=1 Tax=Acropora cervicornis TaxID=6130 RepID=A0AAD9R440_ACRCE|nr:hypothetical protein P5673_001757 [Acropora cervicornis]
MSSSEEEVQFSDENSDESPLSSSPEYEIEHESDGAFASPSASEDEDVAAAFAEEPLADAEWTAQYERERKDNEELEKQLKDRLEGTVAVSVFLRSVSYREFTRLVYGRMGNTRIPLPACTYCAIRKQFPINKDENYVGFELDDD